MSVGWAVSVAWVVSAVLSRVVSLALVVLVGFDVSLARGLLVGLVWVGHVGCGGIGQLCRSDNQLTG